jgi:hypothetical protein
MRICTKILQIGKSFWDWVDRRKIMRRLLLLWSAWLITLVTLRVTTPDVMIQVGAAGATIFGAVVGILATLIGFYQWSRHDDDKG